MKMILVSKINNILGFTFGVMHKDVRPGISLRHENEKGIIVSDSEESKLCLNYLKSERKNSRSIEQTKRLCERIFWFVTFLAGLVIASILTYRLLDKYHNNPVIISFVKSEATVYQVPFPAVTICNVNYLKKAKVQEYKEKAMGNIEDDATQESLKKLSYATQICTAEPTTLKMDLSSSGTKVPEELLDKVQFNNGDTKINSIKSLLGEAAQSCEEMILLCVWEGHAVNCSEIFHEIYTDIGKCCTFNMIPKKLLNRFDNESQYSREDTEKWEKGNLDIDSLLLGSDEANFNESKIPTFPRRIRRAGKSYGLSILLDPELEQYCTGLNSRGSQLITHLPIEVPQIAEYGMGVRPNSEVYINILPDVTSAEDIVRTLAVEKRDCYFCNEYLLQYYKYYTVSNCIDECITNLVYGKCGCVLYHMPRNDSRDLCEPSKFQCTNDIIRSYSETSSKVNCSKCLPTCTQISYLTQSTILPLKDPNLWISSEDSKRPSWANKNVSIVHIYFGHDTIYPKVRKSMYGLTDLISNTECLLGLCLGLSALCGIEFIYYFMVRLFGKNTLRNKQKQEINGMHTIPTTN